MALPTRRIGNDNVSAIGYGAMGIAAFYGAPLPDEERYKVSSFVLIISRPVLNITSRSFSTTCTTVAATSGTLPTAMGIAKTCSVDGQSSTITAMNHQTHRPSRFQRTGKRNDIFLATKFGLAGGIPERTVRADPDYVPQAVEKSLKRLQTDHIDLYYLHRPDPTVPIEVLIPPTVYMTRVLRLFFSSLSVPWPSK